MRSSCTVMAWDFMSFLNLSCHGTSTQSVSCRHILHNVTTSLVISRDTTRLHVVLHHIIHCIAGEHVSTDAARALTCHATRSFVFPCDVETRSYDDGFRWAMFHLKTQLLSGEPRIAGRRERGEASRRVRGSATPPKNTRVSLHNIAFLISSVDVTETHLIENPMC